MFHLKYLFFKIKVLTSFLFVNTNIAFACFLLLCFLCIFTEYCRYYRLSFITFRNILRYIHWWNWWLCRWLMDFLDFFSNLASFYLSKYFETGDAVSYYSFRFKDSSGVIRNIKGPYFCRWNCVDVWQAMVHWHHLLRQHFVL